MHIIGKEKLNKFAQRHPNARSALNRWSNLIQEGTFGSIVELRQTFPYADPVPARSGLFSQAGERTILTVFNIGRQFRLIAFVEYKKQRISIRHILTHDEYTRGRWKR